MTVIQWPALRLKTAAVPYAVPEGRDLRLDFFRGLALWFIFLDHIPDNVVSWITVRNYGFSDATEIFVFISGYTAVIAYGRMMRREGWLRAASRIFRRVWQLYVAHILLFVAFTAQIAYFSLARNAPELIEEMQLMGFGENPYRAIIEAVLLKFRPVNLDVLPLYIVLLASFAFALPSLLRWPWLVLATSFGLYVVALHFDWNLPGYPDDKVWFFNPMAWQAIFYTGAVLAVTAPRLAWLDRYRWPISVAAALYLVFAAIITLSWHYNSLERLIPDWISRFLYPIDKTNLDILRFLHFMAMAWLVRLAVRPNSRFLTWRLLTPIRRCGEHSLQIFCLGTFLALTGQIVVANFEESVSAQLVTSAAGIVIMSVVAYVATWFKAGPAREERV
ncbi:MAG: OpgC domain-containing protein [Alphaproteobacteria bacterium]|nr:OpgC domain-containing protein [Alphaproteobacteria bacterium]